MLRCFRLQVHEGREGERSPDLIAFSLKEKLISFVCSKLIFLILSDGLISPAQNAR